MRFGLDLLSLVLDALELLSELLFPLASRGELRTKVFVLRVRNAATVGNGVWRRRETVCSCLETSVLLLELCDTTVNLGAIYQIFMLERKKERETYISMSSNSSRFRCLLRKAAARFLTRRASLLLRPVTSGGTKSLVLMHARGFFVEDEEVGAADARFAEDDEELPSLWRDASRAVGDVGDGVGALNMCIAAWDDMEGESGDESELVVVAGEGGNWKSKSSRVGKARSG